MKTKAGKLLSITIVTVVLVFAFCLSGFSFGPFEIEMGFDDGSKTGTERFAFGITAMIDETNIFGYGVEIRPTLADEGVIMTIRMLAASNEEDNISADFFTLQVISADNEEDSSYNIRWGSMDENYNVDETYFGYYGGDYHQEVNEDISIFNSYLQDVLYYFSEIIDN